MHPWAAGFGRSLIPKAFFSCSSIPSLPLPEEEDSGSEVKGVTVLSEVVCELLELLRSISLSEGEDSVSGGVGNKASHESLSGVPACMALQVSPVFWFDPEYMDPEYME